MQPALFDGRSVQVGGLPRPGLLARLRTAGVQLNDSALSLLDDEAFARPAPGTVLVVERSVGELGLTAGATLSEIFAAAQGRGLTLCPLITGPYLRLGTLDQRSAPDSVLSNGRAPSASVTVASAPLRADNNHPKGFYLRAIDGVPWLRGYRCTDRHLWSPHDRFVFSSPAP